MKPGARIKISGIKSTPELNDQTGTVVKYDDNLGRWIVKLDSTGKGKGVKAENLTVITGAEGEHAERVRGIDSGVDSEVEFLPDTDDETLARANAKANAKLQTTMDKDTRDTAIVAREDDDQPSKEHEMLKSSKEVVAASNVNA